MTFNLSPIDLAIIALYLVFVIWLGLRLAKKHADAEDYFLAGRSMIWPLVGISLFASNISSTTLVGLSGSAYDTGISVYNYEWMASVVLVFFAVFFLPIYLRSRVYTMPEFLERRYDARSRYYFSILTLVGNIVIDTAGSLYAGGLVLKMIFPQIPMWQTIAALAILAGVYTIAGGLAAVIYTDAVQTVLIVGGSIVVSILAFRKIGSWDAVTAITPPEMLSLVRPIDDPAVPWLGLVTGVSLLGFYFWCTNQFMVQRVLSAKNVDHGRWGALLAGLLKLPVLFIMVLPGTMARVLYPDLAKADQVFPTLMFDLLPVGVLGLVLAGLIAALMSSIDSTLNSASTLVTMDFVAKAKPELSGEKLMWVGRAATFAFMVLAAAWAPQIEKFQTLFQYLQSTLAYIAPPVVAVFLLGVLWRRANAHGAFAALMVGFVTALGLLSCRELLPVVEGALPAVGGVFQGSWISELHFLHVAPLLLLVCVATEVAVSLATAPPEAEKIEPYLWTRKLYAAESAELRGVPWFKNYRVLSVLLLVLTAAVVGWWW